MSGPVMMGHLILERFARKELPRIPEPDLIMSDPQKVEAFMESGREDGILAFLYLFHLLQVAPIIREGDRVLDLACGPGNQLAQIARLNPRAHFIGVDASANMLERAGITLARSGIANVQLRHGDIRDLHDFAPRSFDGVMCTMSLHHLPDIASLQRAMAAAARVLKPNGGIYIADFGRLRRRGTQEFFANDNAAYQLPEFTRDYLNSLRAAFSFDELSAAIAQLNAAVTMHSTALAPFMIVAKSKPRRELDSVTQQSIKNIFSQMNAEQQRNFVVLSRWFRSAGLALPVNF